MSTALERKIAHWFCVGNTGLSSETMALWLGWSAKAKWPSHPYDPDDLDRCLQLLEMVPELRRKLAAMESVSKEWKALIKHWDEIEKSHLDEVGLRWTKARSAPKTYALMQKVLEVRA